MAKPGTAESGVGELPLEFFFGKGVPIGVGHRGDVGAVRLEFG